RKNLKRLIAGASVGALTIAGFAMPSFAATAFMNGSFETGPLNPGNFVTLNTGDTSLTGWTVTHGSVDYINQYWPPAQGTYSLDMSGNEAGTISQTFTTVAGHSYTVTFAMAGNTDGGNVIKTLDVDTGGTPAAYTFDTTGHSRADMGWTTMTYPFTATGSS